MKKYLVLVLFLFSSICLFADYPSGNDLNINGSVLGYDNTSKKWRPIAVDENGNLKTDSSGATQEISVDTSNIETYLKKVDGEDTVTITDLINSIGTDTSKIKQDVSNLAKTAQPSEFRTTRLTGISASTATQINVITDLNSTATNRVFVELRAIDPDDEFYIGFSNSVTDSNGRPVKGRILLSMPSTQNLYIYHTNESALAVQQTEGWR